MARRSHSSGVELHRWNLLLATPFWTVALPKLRLAAPLLLWLMPLDSTQVVHPGQGSGSEANLGNLATPLQHACEEEVPAGTMGGHDTYLNPPFWMRSACTVRYSSLLA